MQSWRQSAGVVQAGRQARHRCMRQDLQQRKGVQRHRLPHLHQHQQHRELLFASKRGKDGAALDLVLVI